MDKKEFYKQMIVFGQELLEKEQKPKLHTEAIFNLQKLYNHLDGAVNAAVSLESSFKDDKRAAKAKKALALIMKIQELMNPLAEDEDIQLV